MAKRNSVMTEYIKIMEKVEWLLVVEGLTMQEACNKISTISGVPFKYKNFTKLTKKFFPVYVEGGRVSRKLLAFNRNYVMSKGNPFIEDSNEKVSHADEKKPKKEECLSKVGDSIGSKKEPALANQQPLQNANDKKSRDCDSIDKDIYEGVSDEAKRIALAANKYFSDPKAFFAQCNKEREKNQ